MMWKSSSLLLVSALSVNAFVTKLPLATSLTKQSRLFVAHPLPQDDDTPSSMFGRPVSEGQKKLNKQLVHLIKSTVFDTIFGEKTLERSFARFWALETIARMPYFSYLTVLHFYETIGRWRKSDYLKIHFAETWNEQHHLLIMEELGGDEKWFDRFVAQHIALSYFWLALAFYFINPTFAYNFNQAVEEEAFETYERFVHSNEKFLKGQPAPQAAKDYYGGGDLYLFDSISTGTGSHTRRPKMKTLYDCFCAIRDDEAEHAKTMIAMQGKEV